MPDNAENWAQLLLSKTLPTPFRLGNSVAHTLNKNQPYKKLATQLSHDPVLSFYITNEANRGRPKGNPTSKTLDHAVSMIGTDELQRLIKGLPHKAPSKSDIKSYYYLRVLSSSLYAAHLGRKIARMKKQANPEDVYWSSMFLGVPLWYLWRFATPEMRLVRYAIRSNFKATTQAEHEVLNCSVMEICQHMAQQMHLPDLTRSCYDDANQLSRRQWLSLAHKARDDAPPAPIEDRDLALKSQQPGFIVMLANLVAHYAAHDWYSNGCLRAQKMMATFLRISTSDAVRLSHEVAADMSREHPIPGLMLPAAKLFLPPRLREKVQAPRPATTKKPVADQAKSMHAEATTPAEPKTAQTAATSTPQIFAPNDMFHELASIMQNEADAFTDLHELMNAATQGIAYGLNLSRATVSLVNRDNSRLKTYYSVGCRDHRELANFETPVIRQTLFEKLLSRPASVWVKPDGNAKVNKLVPMNFKQIIQVDECFLMSIFVGKKPIAIFYADNFGGPALLDGQYSHFKYLCGAVTTALKHQARPKNGDS